MTTEKLSQFKKKIKHYAPEIIVGTSLILGGIAALYLSKSVEDNADDTVYIPLSREMFDRMFDDGYTILFHTDCGDISINRSHV